MLKLGERLMLIVKIFHPALLHYFMEHVWSRRPLSLFFNRICLRDYSHCLFDFLNRRNSTISPFADDAERRYILKVSWTFQNRFWLVSSLGLISLMVLTTLPLRSTSSNVLPVIVLAHISIVYSCSKVLAGRRIGRRLRVYIEVASTSSINQLSKQGISF